MLFRKARKVREVQQVIMMRKVSWHMVELEMLVRKG